jgi:hypothetical protein
MAGSPRSNEGTSVIASKCLPSPSENAVSVADETDDMVTAKSGLEGEEMEGDDQVEVQGADSDVDASPAAASSAGHLSLLAVK